LELLEKRLLEQRAVQRRGRLFAQAAAPLTTQERTQVPKQRGVQVSRLPDQYRDTLRGTSRYPRLGPQSFEFIMKARAKAPTTSKWLVLTFVGCTVDRPLRRFPSSSASVHHFPLGDIGLREVNGWRLDERGDTSSGARQVIVTCRVSNVDSRHMT
jgi:hypothetical protein